MDLVKTLTPNPLPEGAKEVLTRREATESWFLINRVKLGVAAFALCSLLKVYLSFRGSGELIDFLHAMVDLLIVGSATTVGAGGFKSDAHHQEVVQAVVNQRSGAFTPTFDPSQPPPQ